MRRLPGLWLLLGVASLPLPAQQPAPAPAATSPPVRLGGYLQTRLVYQQDVGLTATLNRARLQATGTIASAFSYRLQAEFRTGNAGTGRASASLTDAYIRWSRQSLGIQVGQMKTPFTREYIASINDIETLDRSTVVDSLAPKRDIGITADYQAGRHFLFIAGLFNGEGQNVTTNRDSTLLGVVRVALKPIPEVTLGANVARYVGDSTRYGADVSLEHRALVLRGELVGQARDSLGGTDDLGWFALTGFKLGAEVQLVARYEDFGREAISPQQANRAWSAGINYHVVPSLVRLSGFYVSREIGQPGIRRGMVQTQLQVRF